MLNKIRAALIVLGLFLFFLGLSLIIVGEIQLNHSLVMSGLVCTTTSFPFIAAFIVLLGLDKS